MAKRKTRAEKDADNLAAVLDKIPQMFGEKSAIGERLHDIIMAANPALKPRLWYGMPGYAAKASGPVLVFMRKDKYVTFGISESANFKPHKEAGESRAASSWFVFDLDDATERRIAEIVRVATG